MQKVAIIGMGPAGISVVKTLRNNSFSGEITMFSEEKVFPYSPPALGEYVITGNEEILYPYGNDFFDKFKVQGYLGEKVTQILPKEKKIKTEHNYFDFDHLVICSGSSLYAPVKGSDKKGIYNFKTVKGASEIREMAITDKAKSAIIIGGGFIGVEIALCLAKIGLKTTLLNRRGWIMPRLVDQETAAYIYQDLKNIGVNILLNTEGTEFLGKEKVESLLTLDGQELKADLYIAATGVKPNIDFLKGSGIRHQRGIIVDAYLRTNYPYIYACGDVAETIDLLTNEKRIHGLYPVAIQHGATVGSNILGKEEKYEKQVSMNSLKEMSSKVIAVGAQEGEEIKFKTKNCLRKIFIKNQKIVGFVLVGDISQAGIYHSLLVKQTIISKLQDQLISPHFNQSMLF